MSRQRFVCRMCEEEADEDERPCYCPHCGWNGLDYEIDKVLEDA